MCSGPSQQQKDLEAAQAAFTKTLQQDYSQTFAQQQAILQNLNSVLSPIVSAGPNQQGFSPAELSALSTQAIESNAQGYNQATQAAAAREDAAGGGRSFLPSGVNAQINAELASAAESDLSQEQLGITQANYAQGRANWQNALSGELSVSGQQNPLGYAGATTNANQAAFGEATTIQQMNNQKWSDILGGIASVGMGIATGGLSTLGQAAGGALNAGSAGTDVFEPSTPFLSAPLSGI